MKEIEKLKLKQIRIISAYYDQAIEIRNTAIELSSRFKSIKGAMRIEEDLLKIESIIELTTEKIKAMLSEIKDYPKIELELHELELLKIKDKIIAELQDLKSIQNDIYSNKLSD